MLRVFLLALAAIVVGTATAAAADGTDLRDATLSVLDAQLGLVGTLDGVLHAISLDDGRELWQFNTGSPLVSSANHQSVEKLIPSSLDGSLFSFDSGAASTRGCGGFFADAPPPHQGDWSVSALTSRNWCSEHPA